MSPDFYVGYLPRAPRSIAAFVGRIVIAVFVLGLSVAALLLVAQQPFAASRFEFEQYRPYEGTLIADPYPVLLTATGPYLLVGAGKHGARLPGLEGHHIALEGELIEFGADRALQIQPDTVRPLRASGATPQVEDLGERTLRGEIVDSKCYLGVMNPGSGKVHRDCAARCISGGVPPAFLVRDSSGASRTLLLSGTDGRALNKEVLSYAGEPLIITGHLARQGSTWMFKAEPAGFRRN